MKLYKQNLLSQGKYTKEHQINSYISLLLIFFSFFVVLEFLVNCKAHKMVAALIERVFEPFLQKFLPPNNYIIVF